MVKLPDDDDDNKTGGGCADKESITKQILMLGQILDSGEGPMTFQHPLVSMVNKANGGGGRKMCFGFNEK